MSFILYFHVRLNSKYLNNYCEEIITFKKNTLLNLNILFILF